MSKIENCKYIVNNWLKIKPEDRLLIITNSKYFNDLRILKDAAEEIGAFAVILDIPEHSNQIGTFFNSIDHMLEMFTVIIGASEQSLITNKAVLETVSQGARFLSFPMSTNNGESILSFDFLTMDNQWSVEQAKNIIPKLYNAETVHITTAKGTDLTFNKKGRKADYFAGLADKPNMISSSSFEVYVPIVETATEGVAVLDGSFGYLGKVENDLTIEYHNGVISVPNDSEEGRKLNAYLDSFNDDGIRNAAELGIGLNTKSKCCGDAYIEDESAYGTFHIGMGRNIALGGVHNANGHFDLVFHKPTICADGVCIMKDGEIL